MDVNLIGGVSLIPRSSKTSRAFLGISLVIQLPAGQQALTLLKIAMALSIEFPRICKSQLRKEQSLLEKRT